MRAGGTVRKIGVSAELVATRLEPRPQSMWRELDGSEPRYIATPHGWPSIGCLSGAIRGSVRTHQLIVIARDDDTTFGILHSRFHELWSLEPGHQAGRRKTDPRYTPTTTFQTFPFPEGLTPRYPRRRLRQRPTAPSPSPKPPGASSKLRDRWLNPPEWVEWVDEPAAGYPKRPVPTAARPPQANLGGGRLRICITSGRTGLRMRMRRWIRRWRRLMDGTLISLMATRWQRC